MVSQCLLLSVPHATLISASVGRFEISVDESELKTWKQKMVDFQSPRV